MLSADLVRVCSIQATHWITNPLSGHSWPEYGRITGYEVRGPAGHISTHRSEKAAQTAAQEWREYYQKHPVNYS